MKKGGIIALVISLAVVLMTLVGVLVYFNSSSVKLKKQVDLGNKYLEEEDYEQAIAHYKEAIKIDANDVDAHLGLAKAYMGDDDLKHAISEYEKVVKLDSKNVEAYLGLAEAYESKGELEEAVSILDKGYKKTKNKKIKKALDKLVEKLEEYRAQEAARKEEEERRRQEEEEARRRQEKLDSLSVGYNYGQKIPNFKMMDKNYNTVYLDDYKGKVLYINFFTTWCPYCFYEIPDMQYVKELYGDQVDVLMIDIGESPEEAQAYASQYGIDFTINHISNWGVEGLDIEGVPLSIVIDENGVVVGVHSGQADYNWMNSAVETALSGDAY